MKMKKAISILCAALLMQSAAYANDDITVFLNGNRLEFDQPPIIYNDRTVVPMRKIFEELGMMVQWFEDEQRITAYNGTTNITMFIGNASVYVDNREIKGDVAPMIVGDRTLVPLRIIGESLNGDVAWDGETRTVTINVELSENSDEALEKLVLELTNEERRKKGIDPLVWNEQLAETARAHSRDMVERGFFSHDNPDGKSPFDRMQSAGIKYRSAAENIAAGQATPELAVKEWMNSEGHRRNILNPQLEELGVGIARGGKYGIYWTQNFAAFSK